MCKTNNFIFFTDRAAADAASEDGELAKKIYIQSRRIISFVNKKMKDDVAEREKNRS